MGSTIDLKGKRTGIRNSGPNQTPIQAWMSALFERRITLEPGERFVLIQASKAPFGQRRQSAFQVAHLSYVADESSSTDEVSAAAESSTGVSSATAEESSCGPNESPYSPASPDASAFSCWSCAASP